MKWLYRILRLFFCPHKYKSLHEGSVVCKSTTIGRYYDKECKYCGKMKRYQFEA